MRFVRLMTGMLLLLAYSSGVWAGTVYGPSGLILSPTAYVPHNMAVSGGISTFTTRRNGVERRWFSGTVNAGIANRIELGLTFLRRSGGGTKTGAGAFGKYQLKREGLLSPAIAVGLDYIDGDLGTRQLYLAATKRLPFVTPLAVTVGGIYADRRDGLLRRDSDLFAGVELGLWPAMSLVAEWRSRTKGNLKSGSGVMMTYRRGALGLAVGLINNGNSDSHRFFIGAGYTATSLD